MSVWFQAPRSTFSPSDSRTIGFGQVPVGGRAFDVNEDGAQSPQLSAAAGGIVQNFSMARGPSFALNSKYNFDGPYFTNNSMLFNNQMINNINQNLDNSAWLQVTSQMIIINTSNLEARIAALEAWRQTGIDWTCDAENELIVLRDWEFDSVNNKIINTYRALTIVDGLVVGQDCSLPDGETAVTTCP